MWEKREGKDRLSRPGVVGKSEVHSENLSSLTTVDHTRTATNPARIQRNLSPAQNLLSLSGCNAL